MKVIMTSRIRWWMNWGVFTAVAALGLLTILLVHDQSSGHDSANTNLRLQRSQEAAEAFKHPFDNLVGKPAPDMTLLAVDGTQVRFPGFRGDTVVFFFSLDYCPPCQAEMSALQQLLMETQAKKIRVIGIVRQLRGREVTQNELVARLRGMPIGFPVVIGDYNVDKIFGNIRVVPTTVYIDNSGVIARQSLNQGYDELRKNLTLHNIHSQ